MCSSMVSYGERERERERERGLIVAIEWATTKDLQQIHINMINCICYSCVKLCLSYRTKEFHVT